MDESNRSSILDISFLEDQDEEEEAEAGERNSMSSSNAILCL